MCLWVLVQFLLSWGPCGLFCLWRSLGGRDEWELGKRAGSSWHLWRSLLGWDNMNRKEPCADCLWDCIACMRCFYCTACAYPILMKLTTVSIYTSSPFAICEANHVITINTFRCNVSLGYNLQLICQTAINSSLNVLPRTPFISTSIYHL